MSGNNIYYFIFLWIGAMAILSQTKDVTCQMEIDGETVYRWRLIYALFAFVPVIYLVAFTQARSDTVLYLYVYQNLPTTWVGLVRRFSSSDSGRGFLIFQWIIKNITRGDVTAYRLILALLHSIPVLYVFRKYSSDYLISLYLFVASGCHIGWMMNGLRQFLAVSIIMAATPLLLKKKYIPLIAVILLAATIHTSALIMLPVVFIVQGEPWNIKTLVFILLSIIMMYLFSTYTGLLDTALENTEYAGLMASAEQMGDDGTNSIRVLVNSIPMLLSFVGLGILKQKRNPLINICINMSIITSCLYLISMVTSGVMLGRLPIYTSLYSFILLPYVIKEIFTEASAKLVTVAMIVLYFMYYLYAYYGF